jgi:hydrophobe/amphiphile efflux-3 (HAE3) family protein
MKKLAEGIVKYKWLTIAIVIGITAFFSYQLTNLEIDSDIINTIPDSDPVAKMYKDIGKEFGGNDMGMIVLETDNVFTTDLLEHVKQITDSLKITEGISTVTSITNVLDIKSTDFGLEIGTLVDEYELPTEKAQLDSLRDYVYSKEMYKGSIVSTDQTATLVLFTLLEDADKQAVAKEVKQKIKELNLPEKLYFGGLPMMMNDITYLIVADMVWLIPIVFLLIAFILFLSFHSLRGVILPLLTAGLAVIWTLGILSLTGYKLTIISNVIPIILLAVGSAYTIHVINSINLIGGQDRKQALKKALSYIIVPVILASVTTAVGFISFVFGAYLTMIKDFGIFTSLGTLIALVLSIFFVPAVISAFSMYKSPKRMKRNGEENKGFILERILKPVVNILFKHPKYTLAVWGIVILISLVGGYFIETSVNMADYFKKDNPTRIAEDIMQQKFGGSMPVYVVFHGDMQSPEVLKLMKETGDFMESDPNIEVTQSVADLVEQMNNAMGEGEIIPDARDKIEQLWFLLDGQDIMPQLVSDELDKGIIQSKFASVATNDIEAFNEGMKSFIAENSTENCQIELTGMPPIYVKLNKSLVNSQLSSLVIALLMVLLIVGLILRSALKGLFATIPVIATIIVLFGFMGLTGIPLDIATVLVASIALGIGIDYSIHIITGFNYRLEESGDVQKAIEETIMTSGKAIVINVTSVSAGFLVLMFSQLVPLQNFGLLVAISMFGSGFGALTLLPVVLILANRKKSITAK